MQVAKDMDYSVPLMIIRVTYTYINLCYSVFKYVTLNRMSKNRIEKKRAEMLFVKIMV